MSQTQLEYGYTKKILANYKAPNLVGTQVLPELKVASAKTGFMIFDSQGSVIPSGVKREAGSLIATFEKGTFSTKKIKLEERSGKILTDIQEIDAMKANSTLIGGNLNYLNIVSNQALGKLLINKEKEIATVINTTSNYTHSNTGAISTKWDAAGADIIADIDTAMNKVFTLIGVMPNQIEMSANVWNAVKRNSVILGLLKTTNTKILTTELFGAFFGGDVKVIIGTAAYKASIDSTTMTAIWADNCLVSYNDMTLVNTDSPTFGVTLTHQDYKNTFNTEIKESGKHYWTSATQYYAPTILQNEAGYLMSACLT